LEVKGRSTAVSAGKYAKIVIPKDQGHEKTDINRVTLSGTFGEQNIANKQFLVLAQRLTRLK